MGEDLGLSTHPREGKGAIQGVRTLLEVSSKSGDPRLREQECRGALVGPVRIPEGIRERGMRGRRKGGSYYIRSSLADGEKLT